MYALMENKVRFFPWFSSQPYIVTPHLNHLSETVVMRRQNVCCNEKKKIRKIIPKLSLLALLIWRAA